MTKREQEILDFIRENPFITQQDIADKANITRSSVAVHIRNLTQKGLIKGRAYILADEFFVLCIGNASICLNGNLQTQTQDYRLNDNKYDGVVTREVSGMARNVAEHLIRTDVESEILTVATTDMYGVKLLKSIESMGLSTEHIVQVSEGSPGIELMIVSPDNQKSLLIEDTSLIKQLTPKRLAERKEYIDSARVLFLDDSLSEESIQYLAENCKQPIFVACTCPAGAKKYKPYLDKLEGIVLNVSQAEEIVGYDIIKYRDLRAAAEEIHAYGTKNVFIAQENGGVYYANTSCSGRINEIMAKDAHRQGLADAFSAGVISAYLHKHNIKIAAQYGSVYAKITSDSTVPVSKELTLEKVEQVYEEYFAV